jgi:hypothetical protein
MMRLNWQTDCFFLVGFEVFMAATMKNAVFWDVAPCGFIINRRFGGTFRLQHPSNILLRVIFSTLKMEATRSSETSVYIKPTQRHFPEECIIHILFFFLIRFRKIPPETEQFLF